MTKLMSPKVRVLLDPPGNTTDDLTEYEVQTDNRDAIRWDLTRGRENWPPMGEAFMLWLTFVAWSALNRSGVFPDKFAAFTEQAVEVIALTAGGEPIDPEQVTNDAGVDAMSVGPTNPAAALI